MCTPPENEATCSFDCKPTTDPGLLGTECSADADCGMDGKCIQPTDNDERIGGGMRKKEEIITMPVIL